MKKINLLLLIAVLLISCENQEKIFPDYDYTAVYFPIQFPVRTLSLGDDRVDNSLDRELKFHIGAVIGGMYNNKWDWDVDFILDESLAENLFTSTGQEVKVLPSQYYTMNPYNKVIIPKGQFNGLIQIQLTEEFLADPLAISNHYVIPLRIVSSSADSVLTGFPAISNPDKRVASHWDAKAPPKDFTLFMIKYINPYHGNFLRRGATYRLNANGQPVDTIIYRNQYVERDQIVSLVTTGPKTVTANFTGVDFGSGQSIKLTVESSGNVLIDSIQGARSAAYAVGSSSYISKGESWGGFDQDVIYLNYRYFDKDRKHFETFDTIVFRDRGLKFEEFIPVVEGIDAE
jgi:hypothetical protein